MAYFEVYGGRPLSGEITPQGAKNEALQIICATLLTKERVVLHNVPEIVDVLGLIDLMRNLGVEVRFAKNASAEAIEEAPVEEAPADEVVDVPAEEAPAEAEIPAEEAPAEVEAEAPASAE